MNLTTDAPGRSFAGSLLLTLLAATLLVRCSDEGPLATPFSDGQSLEGAGAVADIGGSWDWSNLEQLTLPVFVAEMFNIPVEGPITHVRCESSGTMEITQIGASFSGSLVREAATCETNGGFDFVPPPDFSPSSLDLVDGSIRGRSIRFTTVGGPLFSPYHGVLSAIESGVATAMKATARTIVPGHPKSPVPLDPPPAGTSKTISWEAERP